MASQEQFTALLQQADPLAGYQLQTHDEGEEEEDEEAMAESTENIPDWMQSWAGKKSYGSTTSPDRPPSSSSSPNKPPQAPSRNGNSEHTPLLALPQSALPPAFSKQPLPPPKAPPRRQRHGRSNSDFVFSQDSSHPLVPLAPPGPGGAPSLPPTHRNRSKPPLRATASGGSAHVPPPPPASTISPVNFGRTHTHPPRGAHRRVKSDIPTSLGGGRIVTKQDLLKNFPDPRWGGPIKPMNISGHNRRRTGSDTPLLDMGSDAGSVKSGLSGGMGHPLLNPGVIGSVTVESGVRKPKGMHSRALSDASLASVTTDMMKSTLIKGVTEKGTIQMQLPKDQFRMLMDSQLETGYVYKRKLIDGEDELFADFHTVDENPLSIPTGCSCHCDCDRCQRCSDKQKRLPPALYVMAVDTTIYRRMLDEIIESQNMPCGMFFCGHHEDVAHPDVKIAAMIVSVVFILLFVATLTFQG